MTGGRALLSDGNFFIMACTVAGGEEAVQRQVSVGVSLPVTLTPGCCLLWCLRGKLTSSQVLHTSCSLSRCLRGNLLLLTSSQEL